MQTTLRILTVGLSLFLGGFIWFVASLPREGDVNTVSDIASLNPEETGIIALTGGGGTRIRAAVSLLDQEAGERILISGVHPDTGQEELAAQFSSSKAQFDCCIDLGHRALTTKGNAIEARDWLKLNGYSTAILVTTDYHVPRAQAEIYQALPEITVVAYPVASNAAPADGWFTSPEAWRILFTEYMKFIAVKAGQLLHVT